ncbi:hypothetical protein [Caulobacter henricii]|uniref:Uncharacterized protein n=1 Tax=Caulobacter henricii TaxID=69395 RepID=A0A0P0P1F1_9CAUL|nr:hypothetical protein [Caulobacter henricii]ALL14303.1 hypothetical protein AQ619_13635 [Caulobacter henricii]
MIRTVRIVLAALSALALVAVATPSTAQTARPLTAQERAARGLDIVRYCAPQIAALGRSSPQHAAMMVEAMINIDDPASIANGFYDGLARVNSIQPMDGGWAPGTGPDDPFWHATFCMGGRAMALDADRVNALGQVIILNSGAVNARLSPASGFPSCQAEKNGGQCALMFTAGKHRLKLSFLDGGELDLGEIQVEAGQATRTTINP